MKIGIELNKNELYDIVIKVGNTTKRIYNASEIKIKNNIGNEELIDLLINRIKVMSELKMKSNSFEKRIKFI